MTKIKLPMDTWIEKISIDSSSEFTFLGTGELKSKSNNKFKNKSKNLSEPQGQIFIVEDSKTTQIIVEKMSLSWQLKDLLKSIHRETLYFIGHFGPIWILRIQNSSPDSKKTHHEGLLLESQFAFMRDNLGSLIGHFKLHQLKFIHIQMQKYSPEILKGLLVGLELGSYNFRETQSEKTQWNRPEIHIDIINNQVNIKELSELKIQAQHQAIAVNLARHLVNLPPNVIHPQSFAHLIAKQMQWPSTISVEVWNAEKLKKEKLNLLLAVGAGGSSPPCMVVLKYQPRAAKSPSKNAKGAKVKPIAFVGKGVTFDTGGLDIKPSAAMRLMKKDMGGAATLLGLAYWLAHSQSPQACHFYFTLAENSLDKNSFRPSDVIESRNGLEIEIDNTDAEGRLVMADAMSVAVQEDIKCLIDVATLTGAIKVALGAEIAGLFSNDDELAQQLLRSGQSAGDICWRMPLYEKYFTSLNSNFADFKNSAEGFGGAITASLFLQKFVQSKPWAHLDIYSWTDRAQGSLTTVGGSGQGVQLLIEFLSNSSEKF